MFEAGNDARQPGLRARLKDQAPLWIIAVLCVLMASHMRLHTTTFPYTPDSASYFEQARTLLTEGAALETPYAPNNEARQPSRLFPVGYPVILASIGLTGIDPRDAALLLTRSAGLLLPILLFVSFRQPLGARNAAVMAALSLSSPSTLSYSTLATSDLLSLLLAVATIGIVLNKQSRSWLMFAGALGGGAYAVRNAQLALLASIAFYYFFLWSTQTKRRREITLNAAAFLLGVSLILLPVLIRNMTLFGAINPYHMAPSTLSAIHNVRTFIQEMAYDLSGVRSLGIVFGWSTTGIALMLLMAAGAAWFLKTSWSHLSTIRKNTIFLCTAYAAIGASVVIAARARYEWGEMINIRHTLQYTPFLWVAIIGGVSGINTRPHARAAITTLFLFVMGVLHVMYIAAPRDLVLQKEREQGAIAALSNGKDFLCHTEAGTITASNWGYVFRIACDTPTRNIEMDAFECPAPRPGSTRLNPDCEMMTEASIHAANQLSGQSIKIGLFMGRGIDLGSLPLPENHSTRLQQAAFNINRNSTHGLLLSRQAR